MSNGGNNCYFNEYKWVYGKDMALLKAFLGNCKAAGAFFPQKTCSWILGGQYKLF